MEQMKVNVLGTEYTVEYVEKYPEYLSEFEETADALCNSQNRAIYVKLNNDKDMTEQGSMSASQGILMDAAMPLMRERIESPLSPFTYKDELEKELYKALYKPFMLNYGA